MKMKITMVTLCILLIVNVVFSGVIVQYSSGEESARTLYVGSTQAYKTVQKAIDVAQDGDTIYVSTGVYSENLLIEKSIALIGENATMTIIQGVSLDPVINISATNVTITDLQIQGKIFDKNNRSMSAISLGDSSDINISNCHLSDCEVALRIWDTTDLTISSCTITDNNAGVFPFNSSYITIVDTGITTNNFYGLSIINSSFVHISRSEISNSQGSGIMLRNAQNNLITYNLIKNNSGYGVVIYKSSKTINASSLPLNMSRDPDNITFYNATQTVVIQYPSLGNKIYQNNFIGNNIHAFDGYKNSWDNGGFGNYWDDYYGEDLNGDNIGDISYVFFGNQDYYPLMTPVEYTGASNVTLPVVRINMPVDGAALNGTITISGVSSSTTGEIQEVMVKISGDSNWTKAQGTTTWLYVWNTTSYENGQYKIFARSTDGNQYSLLSEISVTVNNSIKENGSTPGFEILVVFLSIFMIVFFFRRTYKKR